MIGHEVHPDVSSGQSETLIFFKQLKSADDFFNQAANKRLRVIQHTHSKQNDKENEQSVFLSVSLPPGTSQS